MGLLFFTGMSAAVAWERTTKRAASRRGQELTAPTTAAGGERMIFNMAGYVIQETAEPQTAAPDTETAAEAEPPQEA